MTTNEINYLKKFIGYQMTVTDNKGYMFFCDELWKVVRISQGVNLRCKHLPFIIGEYSPHLIDKNWITTTKDNINLTIKFKKLC